MDGWSGLLAALLAFASGQLDAGARLALPEVTRVEQSEIARIVCGRPCSARAVYLPGRGILFDAALDPVADAYARSILLHELVHHVQEREARFSDLPECRRWTAREQEAYGIQRRYLALAQTGIVVRALLRRSC
jgi:hypothetical protein